MPLSIAPPIRCLNTVTRRRNRDVLFWGRGHATLPPTTGWPKNDGTPVRIWGDGQVRYLGEQQSEDVMFRFVGWFVVTSFALYGAAQFVRRHVVIDATEEA